MTDILIIAPTATYKRDPAQIAITDDIKDHTDAVNVIHNIAGIVPDASGIPETKHSGNKQYYDMRAAHQGNSKIDFEKRLAFFQDAKNGRKSNNSYPDMQAGNCKYIKGINQAD